MNFLDKLIEYVSPEAALRRQFARETLATYPDAVPSRLDPSITAPGTSADWDLEMGQDRRKLVDRVRQMERENPFANALLDRTVELVVGHGFRVIPTTQDPKWNAEFVRLWREYCHKEFCDYRGLVPLHQGIALTFRGYLRDGEGGYIKIKDGTLRSLESDEIGNPGGTYIRPGTVDGIELDARGRIKSFRIYKPDMNALYSDRRISGNHVDVPAEHVLFWARRTRSGQTRGLTAFNGVFWALDQIKGSIEAMTVSLRMAACIGLVIRRATPFNAPTSPDPNSPTGVSRNLSLVPGKAIHLLPGEDVTPIMPQAPAGFENHVRLLIRIACTPFGLPLEVALGDFGPLNLSSARANLQQALRTARIYQGVVEHGYNEIADWKAQEWIESGRLWKVEDFRSRRWVKPRQLVMDPVSEIQADIAELDAGLKTLEQAAEERGLTAEELVEQRKLEKEMLEDAGLEPVKSTLTRDPAPSNVEGKAQDIGQVKAAIVAQATSSRQQRRVAARPHSLRPRAPLS